jgi:PPE-repeat protein
VLLDILSKREGLYRSFLRTKSNVVALPHSLTVSPKNSLLREIQASYLFIDPTTYGSEFTREFLYQNTNYLRYTFIKDFLRLVNQNTYNLPINFNLLSNYFVHLLGPSNEYGSIGHNSTLFKSQYRPMKKGVVNMIRLQATNAIAMPTEIRLHILASSKDVIHS